MTGNYHWDLGPIAVINQMRHNLQPISIPHFRLEIGFQIETDRNSLVFHHLRQTPRDALNFAV